MEDCQHHHACLDDAKALKKGNAVSHGEGGQNVNDENHRIGHLDMDMPRWVEERKEVLVETVDWTMHLTARQRSDSWVGFQYKVPAVAS